MGVTSESSVAIVTGAGSGIGKAITARFIHAGMVVHGIDVSKQEGMFRDAPWNFRAWEADVRSARSASEIVESIRDEHGRLDILVTSAAILAGADLAHTSLDDFRHVLDVNVLGCFNWLSAASVVMAAQGRGSIVLLSSQLAYRGARRNFAYATSKGAVSAMMRTAALELAPFGVRVNAVVPAVVDTPMSGAGLASRPDPEAARQALIARHPLGRFATPEEIAAAVHFLATEATFSTGSEMYVDGGWMIN